MQAIQTKVVPITNTKPTRIKAWCERGQIYVVRSLLPDPDNDAHQTAAQLLCWRFAEWDAKKYGKDSMTSNPWLKPRVSGTLPNGDFVHVFIE